jgi:hypothetical protein
MTAETALRPSSSAMQGRCIRDAAALIVDYANRHPGSVLLAGIIGYLSATIPIAVRRPLWNDELYTIHAASAGLRTLWDFLATGAEQTPR